MTEVYFEDPWVRRENVDYPRRDQRYSRLEGIYLKSKGCSFSHAGVTESPQHKCRHSEKKSRRAGVQDVVE